MYGRQEQDDSAEGVVPATSLSDCGTLDELCSAVLRQADSLSGVDAAKGLTRLINLSMGRTQRVRGMPASSVLLLALERNVEDLAPKVLLWSPGVYCESAR